MRAPSGASENELVLCNPIARDLYMTKVKSLETAMEACSIVIPQNTCESCV